MTEAILVQGKYKSGYILKGLACSSCAEKIEKEVTALSYVIEATMNFALSKITVIGNNKKVEEMTREIQEIVDEIEYGITVIKDEGKGVIYRTEEQLSDYDSEYDSKSNQNQGKNIENNYLKWLFWPGVVLFALAIVFFEVPVVSLSLPGIPMFFKWLLYGSSYLLIGGPVLVAALRNIRRGQVFDENFLMGVATLGAFAIQEFPEGVAVMLFYMIGDMFQNKAVDRSRRSIKELMNIRPDYANLKHGEGISKVEPESVEVGDIIVIKPGERVPLDGEVLEGSSMVDTSALTGESIPRKVESGDDILSGMINKDSLLTVRISKVYGQSTVAKILELVENASGKKAPTEKFITKFSHYYTPVVVYAALAMAVLPPLFLSGATFSDWVYRALIFLVVSCPCALVVSIPLGFFGGIGRASRQGILVKGGNYLEALNNVSQIVFDKTGTLTKGKFAVSKVEAFNGFNKKEVLTKAAYAEVHSTHPIAKSILEAYDNNIENKKIEYYQDVSGYGIKATIDGQQVLAGNIKLMDKEGIRYQEVDEDGTIVYLAIDKKYAGYIIINDELKEDSVDAIKDLKQIGVKELIMLTGDRDTVARKTAQKLGLDQYHAELLPAQKVEKLEEILSRKKNQDKLIFVGDGINDAPVLARSDIGIAMGGLGSDAAIEAADIVLMTDDPSKLVTAINTARKTRQIVWQNIFLAMGVKAVVLTMGVFGIATMWEAVFADVGVALLAVLNAMRISRNV